LKKTVAVIGATESSGPSIAYILAEAGYRVLLTNNFQTHRAVSLGKLSLLLARIRLRVRRADVRIALSAREASWEADIIIPVVPYEAQAELARTIKDVATGKIVACMINPLNRSHSGLEKNPPGGTAQELTQLLPHSSIVKAFMTSSSAVLRKPRRHGETADVFICSDNEAAAATVMQLAEEVGLSPHAGGKLAMSRAVESMMCEVARLRPGQARSTGGAENSSDEIP